MKFNTNDILSECTFKTSRSSGPGGQHANKVETRVTLLFNINKSTVVRMGIKNVDLSMNWVVSDYCRILLMKKTGIIINKDLKTHELCVAARNKVNKYLNMMRLQVECKSPEIITKMYNANVKPLLELAYNFGVRI